MNVVLCGMMGSGKTAVASAFADLYGVQIVDTDAVIVSRYGEINAIFANHGEEYFRNIESEVCKEVSMQYSNAVISLGGGAVLRAQNVQNLKKTGKIIYLKAKAQTIIERLQGDTTRPLLKGGLEEKVNSILANRSAIYEGVADVVIETDSLTPEQIAKVIKEELL
ncbi:MAG: shikimate kinase [Candidatus Coproplasma sp.]